MAFPKCIYLQGRVSNYICVFVCGVWKFSKPQQAAGINNCHSWRTILHLVNATLPERKKTNRKNFPLDVLHTVRARAKWKGANNESFARSESERLKTKWKEKKNVLFLFTFPVAMFRYNCFFFLHTDFNVFYLFFFVSIFSSTLFSLPCHLRASPFTRKVTECKEQKNCVIV